MTEHPSLDLLADLAAGIADDPGVAQHVASCPACTADLAALAAVSADLAALPPLAIPADVASRLDAALAAEQRPTTPAPNVVPLTSRQPRVPGWVSAAAVAVIAVGGSALLVANGVFDGLGSSSKQNTAGLNEARAPRTVLSASGIDYTAKNLLTNLTGLLSGQQPTPAPASDKAVGGSGEAAPQPGAAPSTTGASAKTAQERLQFSALTALNDPTALAGCLTRALGTDLGTPLAVDLASFDGRPAVVAAYTADGHPNQVDVYVLDPTCPEGKFEYFGRLTPPSPS